MKPVLVLQNMKGDGPAYLAQWLAREGIAMDLRMALAGDALPADLSGHAALAVLGGEMSANDPLPELRATERLIALGFETGVPVIGHCLGGQLMARALGARVVASPLPEIGWQAIQMLPGAEREAWFGPEPTQHVMHWHNEAFELPAGAVCLGTNAACAVQAFAYGPHLGMQFHIEVNDEKLGRWSASRDPAYLRAQQSHPDTVHTGDVIRAGTVAFLQAQQRLADRVYARWWSAHR